MIIYALIIIACLFFLAWNLISNRKAHLVATLVTTVLFILTVVIAVANFGYHYGMHRVNKPVKTQSVESLSPLKSLKTITYQPMGTNHDSQLVVYKQRRHVIHTTPDINVHNRIVRKSNLKYAHVKTRVSKWEYRSKWDRWWFNIAEKPSVSKVSHVFYVPDSWKILSVKQTLAFKQIIKNRSLQLKRQINTPQNKQRMKAQVSAYVKTKMESALEKNPKMSKVQKARLMKRSVKEFKAQNKRSVENKLAMEALRTSETIH